MNLKDIIERAQDLGSYFITITTKDKSKEENDLVHYAFQQEFPRDDIIPSVDACIRSMGVKPQQPVPIIKPEVVREPKPPLKIAILSHFNRMPESYSPARAVKNQIKILQEFGHQVVFFTQEGSQVDVGCEMRSVVTKFKREKNVVNEEAKQKFIDVLREHLTADFDLAITHDFYIDDCITYKTAIMECGIPIQWLHWARSGVGRNLDFNMDNARYVYMNYSDAGLFAQRIGVTPDKVRVVFNEKDPSYLYGWDPVTSIINDKLKLWDKDIIQTYPICTTRQDAKGLNSVINTFAALKRRGKKVALIICNANGRKRLDEIKSKLTFAADVGLVDGEDILYTSTLANDQLHIESEVSNKVVTQLMQISNLFVFPTIAEVSSNIQLEASMTKQLLVLNEDLPSLFDFVDQSAVLKYPFTSLRSLHYSGRDEKGFDDLAKKIIGQLESNKADKQFRHVWKNNCKYAIYHNMLEPILYEKIKKD